MTGRAFKIELLRGAAPVAATGALVGGLLSLYSLAGGWAGWPGRWMPFAASVRMSLFVIGAITVACAAWQGGRERRRRVGDQMTSAPRPPWQPVVLAWAAVTLGSTVALLVLVAVGAAFVAPVATYSGGGWWWVLAVAIPGLSALSALGFVFGRLIPSRLAAPVVGIVSYLLMVGVIDTVELGSVRWLAPVISQYEAPGYQLSAAFSAQQAWWFAGLTVTVLVFASAGRRWLAVVPAGAAAVAGVFLIAGPADPWQRDQRALEAVCADGTPEVCLTRLNAFLLDDLLVAAQPVFARWEGIADAPVRVIDDTAFAGRDVLENTELDDGSVFRAQLNAGVTLVGGLAESYEGESYLDWWPEIGCSESTERAPHDSIFRVAAAWGSAQEPHWFESSDQAALSALEGLPADAQRTWLGGVVAAARACDHDMLEQLAEELW